MLTHDAVEDAHDFIRAVGHGERFAPGTCFANAEGVLSEDVRSDVVFGADDEGGENTRIGVNLLNCGRTVAHGSRFTPLGCWYFGFWILDFGLRTVIQNPKSPIQNRLAQNQSHPAACLSRFLGMAKSG